jgi:hypothetical protein
MAKGWTPERRARQADLIRAWRPWEKSTGPRSAEGKARSAARGFKGGHRAKLRAMTQRLSVALREQRQALDELAGEGGT